MINKKNNAVLFGMIFIMVFSSAFSLVSSFSISNPQITNPGADSFSYLNKQGISAFGFNPEQCKAGQDFIVQILPFSCSPAVVRSDLLEEQNVPVFCQLTATQINPLIKVNGIDFISFSGEYPKEISGVGFHPANAAVKPSRTTLLNSPTLQNIGYAVIVLKQHPNESAMPEFVRGNLTANIKYNIENAFGVGGANLYLPFLSDDDWDEKYVQYGFWNGKGYLRAEDISSDSGGAAVISVYSDKNTRLSTFSLQRGQTSGNVYLPGFYCNAGLKLRLDALEIPDTRVKLNVNGDIVEVPQRGKFLNNACTVGTIVKQGINKKTQIVCTTDDGIKRFNLAINPKVRVEISGETKEVNVGDRLYNSPDNKAVYLAYAGTGSLKQGLISETNSGRDEDIFTILLEMPTQKEKLSESELSSMGSAVKRYSATKIGGNIAGDLGEIIANSFTGVLSDIEAGLRILIEGKSYQLVQYNEQKTLAGKDIKILGFATPQNDESVFAGINNLQLKGHYENATKDYRQIIDKFANERQSDLEPTLGEQAFVQAINLANDFNQKKTANDFCEEFRQKYPKSNNIPDICDDKIVFSNSELASQSVFINGNLKKISIDGIYEPSLDEYSAEFFVRDSSGKTNPYILTKNQIVFLGEGKGTLYSYESKNILNIASNIYLKYNGKNWQWSFEKTCWMDVSQDDKDIVGKGCPFNEGKQPLTEQKEVIKDLFDLDLRQGEIYLTSEPNISPNVKKEQSRDYIQLVSLDENYSVINYNLNGYSGTNQRIALGTSNAFRSNYLVSLSKINLKKQARVSLIPNIQNAGTQANFSFNIGIDKRAIQLSPEKIQEKITNLNSSISKWQGLSENVGNVAKGFNAACLLTGTALTAKNFFENLDGKSIARQEVMRGNGGWMDVCSKEIISTKESIDACLLKHNSDIEKDVDSVYKIIEEQNKNPVTEENLCDVLTELKPDENEEISNGLQGFNAKKLTTDKNLLSAFGKDAKTGKCERVSLTQARDIQRLNSIISSSSSQTAKNAAAYEKFTIISDINENVKGYAEYNSFIEELNKPGSSFADMTVNVYGGEKSIQGIYGGGKTTSQYQEIPQNTPVQAIVYNNEKYLLGLNEASRNTYTIKDIYDANGIKVIDESKKREINSRFSKFNKYDENSYHNPFLKPEVKYFETEPYKGRPALVPFNTKDGWYVAMRQTIQGFGNIRTYDESGRVENFYLCNVGTNGKPEFNSGINDDTCRAFSPATGNLYGEFPGLTQSETNKLVSKGIQAVADASRQYRAGLSGRIRILGEMIPVGSPAVDLPEVKCQDFMSPSDCNLLFNACDPVVCPSSRCNLGGTYHVSNVIQSGIVGSTLLCLPNAKENIYVPVCLSGIKAGLDNYVSLQKNYRDCLQENLKTGRTIGICDEIHSIYLCDFFWNQAQPLSQVLIPKAFEFLTGQNQGTRGGGEYLNVQSAWQNAQDSLNYITNYYGADSFKTFKTQAIGSIGGAFCKSFVSAQYPSKLGFDSLLKPASPPQFTAYFSENSFTTATVPPISQYKVFYHIFAGENEGAYYSVYLKSPVGTSFYQTNPTYTVATGFVGLGDYASETKDFTAPTGYKELCIRVNSQEECGFQKVTTDFALNYLTDKYLQEQASQTNINSEASCVSGTASAYSLINPNLQAGVQNVISPELYNYQIVRICSTENPGKATDAAANTPGGRWQKVGTCDGKTGKLNCYLDTKSVKDAIKAVDLENQTLNDVTKNNPNILTEIKTEDIEKFRTLSNQEKIFRITNDLISKVTFNLQKAQLLFIRGVAYENLAKAIKEKLPAPTTATPTTTAEEIPTATGITEVTGALAQDGNKLNLVISSSATCSSIKYEIWKKNGGNILDLIVPDSMIIPKISIDTNKLPKIDIDLTDPNFPSRAARGFEKDGIYYAKIYCYNKEGGLLKTETTEEIKLETIPVEGVYGQTTTGPSLLQPSARANRIITGIYGTPNQEIKNLETYNNIISQTSALYEIPPNLIKAIIIQESSAKPDARNIDSYGLMQVSADAVEDVIKRYGKSGTIFSDAEISRINKEDITDLFDANKNIHTGTAYYKILQDHYESEGNSGDDLKKITLAAYNWGRGNVQDNCKDDKWVNCKYVPQSTLQYISDILEYEKNL
ncbi:transglycosylase SLT domain-containing protein [Candidatus Pacearchaeota archaeon]|nr:transglycosylase SLT domain-containing protein [Candidatus Pacearchaeota archaeon]